MSRYKKIITESGPFVILIPNTVIEGNGFYITHNARDTAQYGCQTTALVLGEMEKFYILNGDHRQQYMALIDQGFDACLSYFKAHLDQINKYSDQLNSTGERT
jgi:hypothetical protein